VDNHVNKACFTVPAVLNPSQDPTATGFGNTPNGVLRQPDQADIVLSLSKTQMVQWPKEGASVQLRADFFNALNHPNFAGPNNTASNSTIGDITAMSTNPRVIQFSLGLRSDDHNSRCIEGRKRRIAGRCQQGKLGQDRKLAGVLPVHLWNA
jgi:hypothetical protein